MGPHGPSWAPHPHSPPTPQITQFGPRRPPDPPELCGSSGEFDPTRFRSNSFHCNGTGIRPFLKDEPFSAFPVTNKNFLRPKAAASQCRPPLWAIVGAGGARSKGSGGRMGMDGGGSPPGKPFFSIFVARPTWWPHFKRDPRPAGTDHAPTWKQKACLFPPRAVVRPRGAQIELVRFARPAPRGDGPCPDLETKGLFVSTSGHGPPPGGCKSNWGCAGWINNIDMGPR